MEDDSLWMWESMIEVLVLVSHAALECRGVGVESIADVLECSDRSLNLMPSFELRSILVSVNDASLPSGEISVTWKSLGLVFTFPLKPSCWDT